MAGVHSDYIKRTIGPLLTQCLREVAEVQPKDPIDFLARMLYNKADSELQYYQKVKEITECERARLKFKAMEKKRRTNIEVLTKKVHEFKQKSVDLEKDIELEVRLRQQILEQSAAALSARRNAQFRAAKKQVTQGKSELRQLQALLSFINQSESTASSAYDISGSSSATSLSSTSPKQSKRKDKSNILSSSASSSSTPSRSLTNEGDKAKEDQAVLGVEKGTRLRGLTMNILNKLFEKGRNVNLLPRSEKENLHRLRALSKAFQEGKDIDLLELMALQRNLRGAKAGAAKFKTALLSRSLALEKQGNKVDPLFPTEANNVNELVKTLSLDLKETYKEVFMKFKQVTVYSPSVQDCTTEPMHLKKDHKATKKVAKKRESLRSRLSSGSRRPDSPSQSLPPLHTFPESPVKITLAADDVDPYASFSRGDSSILLSGIDEETESSEYHSSKNIYPTSSAESFSATPDVMGEYSSSEISSSNEADSKKHVAKTLLKRKKTGSSYLKLVKQKLRIVKEQGKMYLSTSQESTEEDMIDENKETQDKNVVKKVASFERPAEEEQPISFQKDLSPSWSEEEATETDEVDLVEEKDIPQERKVRKVTEQERELRSKDQRQRKQDLLTNEEDNEEHEHANEEHEYSSEEGEFQDQDQGSLEESISQERKKRKKRKPPPSNRDLQESESSSQESVRLSRGKRKKPPKTTKTQSKMYGESEAELGSNEFEVEALTRKSRPHKKDRRVSRNRLPSGEVDDYSRGSTEEREENREFKSGRTKHRKFKKERKPSRESKDEGGGGREFAGENEDNEEIKSKGDSEFKGEGGEDREHRGEWEDGRDSTLESKSPGDAYSQTSLGKQEALKKRDQMRPKPTPVSWQCSERQQLVCRHPVLGDMTSRPPFMSNEEVEWWERAELISEVYLHNELYTRQDDDFVELYDQASPGLTLRHFTEALSEDKKQDNPVSEPARRSTNWRPSRASRESYGSGATYLSFKKKKKRSIDSKPDLGDKTGKRQSQTREEEQGSGSAVKKNNNEDEKFGLQVKLHGRSSANLKDKHKKRHSETLVKRQDNNFADLKDEHGKQQSATSVTKQDSSSADLKDKHGKQQSATSVTKQDSSSADLKDKHGKQQSATSVTKQDSSSADLNDKHGKQQSATSVMKQDNSSADLNDKHGKQQSATSVTKQDSSSANLKDKHGKQQSATSVTKQDSSSANLKDKHGKQQSVTTVKPQASSTSNVKDEYEKKRSVSFTNRHDISPVGMDKDEKEQPTNSRGKKTSLPSRNTNNNTVTSASPDTCDNNSNRVIPVLLMTDVSEETHTICRNAEKGQRKAFIKPHSQKPSSVLLGVSSQKAPTSVQDVSEEAQDFRDVLKEPCANASNEIQIKKSNVTENKSNNHDVSRESAKCRVKQKEASIKVHGNPLVNLTDARQSELAKKSVTVEKTNSNQQRNKETKVLFSVESKTKKGIKEAAHLDLDVRGAGSGKNSDKETLGVIQTRERDDEADLFSPASKVPMGMKNIHKNYPDPWWAQNMSYVQRKSKVTVTNTSSRLPDRTLPARENASGQKTGSENSTNRPTSSVRRHPEASRQLAFLEHVDLPHHSEDTAPNSNGFTPLEVPCNSIKPLTQKPFGLATRSPSLSLSCTKQKQVGSGTPENPTQSRETSSSKTSPNADLKETNMEKNNRSSTELGTTPVKQQMSSTMQSDVSCASLLEVIGNLKFNTKDENTGD